jgi:hypothetical protein
MSCCEQEEEATKRHTSFSLQISTQEGFSIRGELQMETTRIPARASRHTIEPETLYDDVDADVKPYTSTLRLKREKQSLPTTQPLSRSFQQVKRKALIIVLLALLVLLPIDSLGYPLWQMVTHQLQYGSYPTAQLDAHLGHGGISHLTAYTYQDNIMLIESVGNKVTPYVMKVAEPFATPRVVTITIADVNLDHRPDVLLHVDGLTQSIIFDNTGTGLVLGVAA